MINFFSETIDFSLTNQQKSKIINWISNVLKQEGKSMKFINYVFCTDDYLLKINSKYLNHSTLTDIITFDYSTNGKIASDIFISIERVKENAIKYNTNFNKELYRVMVHGALHLAGYKDKTSTDKKLMRAKEDFYLNLLSF